MEIVQIQENVEKIEEIWIDFQRAMVSEIQGV